MSKVAKGVIENTEAEAWGLKPLEYRFALNYDAGVRPMVEAFEQADPQHHSTRHALGLRASRVFNKEKFQLFLKHLGYRRLAMVEKAAAEVIIPDVEVITNDRIKMEESCLAFSNIKDLYAEDGTFIPIPDLPDRVARAIREFEGVIIEGDDGKRICLIKKLRFYDKGDALSRLERISGMLSDKSDINVNINLKALLLQIDGQSKGRLPNEVG
jgi:hypothetical protein